jgi:hypothetical protein
MTTIDQFYASRHCIVCDGLTPAKLPICQLCAQEPQLTTSVLMVRPSCCQTSGAGCCGRRPAGCVAVADLCECV